MIPTTNRKLPRKRTFKSAAFFIFCLWLSVVVVPAENLSFANFLAQGELADQRNDVPGALNFYSAVDRFVSTNCGDLCRLAKRYCDLMHFKSSPTTKPGTTSAVRATEAGHARISTSHFCDAQEGKENLCSRLHFWLVG